MVIKYISLGPLILMMSDKGCLVVLIAFWGDAELLRRR